MSLSPGLWAGAKTCWEVRCLSHWSQSRGLGPGPGRQPSWGRCMGSVCPMLTHSSSPILAPAAASWPRAPQPGRYSKPQPCTPPPPVRHGHSQDSLSSLHGGCDAAGLGHPRSMWPGCGCRCQGGARALSQRRAHRAHSTPSAQPAPHPWLKHATPAPMTKAPGCPVHPDNC